MDNIRILGLNGSPRSYGNTYMLLRIALKAAEREGAVTKLINLYDYYIEDCIGCVTEEQYACRYPCVIEDDMKKIYDEIIKSDGIIFASPIYWFSPSAVMKRVIDRLTALENMIFINGKSWVEGKVAGVIAVGNDSGEIQLISLMYSILNSMGFIIPPYALAYFARTENILDHETTLLDSANVGRAVVLMAKLIRNFKDKWYDVELKDQLRKIIDEVLNEAKENKKKIFKERYDKITKLLRKLK